MTQQISAGRTFMGGRGFSSASAVCGLGGNRTYVASVRHPIGNGCGVPHFSSQSLSNMGGSRRISYGGYGAGYHGGYSYGHAGYNNLGFGGRMGHYGPNIYESVGSCGPLRGYANSRSDGIQGVRINEKLLKPLHVGVDPQEQVVRNHEREEMKNLNNQFACFIDKVRYLEQQNKVLETKWNLLQECAIPARKNIEPYYENFICNMKRQLECLSADREKLASEHGALQQVVDEFKCKYEEEVKRRASAENEFVLLKKDVDCIAMSKAELEGKLDLLVRELEFRRCVYPQELAQFDGHVCDTNILLQMDNSRDLNIDFIIKNVEAWYQTVAQRSKEEVNALYENRFQELQEQRGKYTDDLKINQHEIADLSRLVQKLQCEHDNVKKQVDSLQTAICDVEQRGDGALKDARHKHVELQTALQKAKDDLAGLLRDYHELLNTKLALDIEIATYRTLLEGEESRICTGNLVTFDVVRPPFIGNAAGFPASYGYGPTGGGYNGGYGESHGRYSRNFSSRSVGHGQPSRPVVSTAATGHSSADAEFYSGTRQGSRNVSYSVGKKNTPGDIDSSSTAGVNVNCGPGGGYSSGSAQGSAVNVGKGRTSGSIVDSCPDGGYLSGGCAPVGAIPYGFGTGGMGPNIVGGPVAVGCNPGCLGGGGSIGVPAMGIPAVGVPAMGIPAVGVPAMGIPAVGVPAMGIPAVGVPAMGVGGIGIRGQPCVGVGAPVGVCYPGAVGVPVNGSYPGGVGLLRNTAM